MISILTSSMCSHCKELKDKLKREGKEYTEISVDTDEGYQIAVDNGIQNLPGINEGDGWKEWD